MNSMTGDSKVFLDSNILLYLIDKDGTKKERVQQLLRPDFFISTQVISENINVCLKKLKLSKETSFQHAKGLLDRFIVLTIEKRTISLCLEISTKYQLSYWDSLIIATAIEGNCDLLYSEDLQHNLSINKKITIINSFSV
jgi:predicted nucleic acid-binding protein